MTALLHFEDKVHRKGLARAESIPLLMPRLLCQVLEHLGFPEEPRILRRFRCPQILSMERAIVIPISFLLQQQDKEEVPDQEAEDSHRRYSHAPEIEHYSLKKFVERRILKKLVKDLFISSLEA